MSNTAQIKNGYIIHKVKINQIRTAALRGYPLDDEDRMLLKMDQDSFIEYYTEKAVRDKINFYLGMNKVYKRIVDVNGDPSSEGNTEENYFYFVPMNEEKSIICVGEITPLVDFVVRTDIKYIDMITHAPLHSWSNSVLSRIKNKYITPWIYEELMIFPFESQLVPDYHVMTQDEIKKTFYDDNGKPFIKRSKMIAIKMDDPIVKFLRVSSGTIIRFIEEQNYIPSLVGKRLSYRVVVPGTIFESSKRSSSEVLT